MKTLTKKLVSAMLSLAVLTTFVSGAFAASAPQANIDAEMLLASATYKESVFLDDGTEIIFAVVPAAVTRGSVDISSAWARPTATQTFKCRAEDGNYLNIRTTNIGETTMRVTDALYEANGDFITSVGREVEPGGAFITYSPSENTKPLTIKIETTIEAVRSSSANYSYRATQSWVTK